MFRKGRGDAKEGVKTLDIGDERVAGVGDTQKVAGSMSVLARTMC